MYIRSSHPLSLSQLKATGWLLTTFRIKPKFLTLIGKMLHNLALLTSYHAPLIHPIPSIKTFLKHPETILTFALALPSAWSILPIILGLTAHFLSLSSDLEFLLLQGTFPDHPICSSPWPLVSFRCITLALIISIASFFSFFHFFPSLYSSLYFCLRI